MIFGKPGSGKSTFSVEISEKLNIPLYHVDRYFFTNHWQERDKLEFISILQNQVDLERWIIDGNAISYLDVRYQKCDLAIYFNFPTYQCLWGVFKRLFYRDTRIQDRAENCHERITWNLLKYLWRFSKRVEPILKNLKNDYPHVMLIVVKNKSDLRKLLESNAV